jgi:hypothetical protein
MRVRASIAAALLLVACSKGSSDNAVSEKNEATSPRLAVSAAGGRGRAIASGSPGAVSGVAQQDFATAPAPNASPADATGSTFPQSTAVADTGGPGAALVAPSMVIRNGQASVEVDKLDPAIAKLRQLATQLGGYVANSSVVGGRDQVRSATLELKIPAQRFDQAINGLGTLGKVESVNATAEDVGEEFVDITARVNNARRLEERLVTLLATRTGKLEDVLAVERELARVREQIERYEGRLRFLRTRVAISTLSVTIHEPTPILGQSPGQNPIVAAIRQAWRNFVGFIAAAIASLGIIIPFAALILVGWIIYKRVRKRVG